MTDNSTLLTPEEYAVLTQAYNKIADSFIRRAEEFCKAFSGFSVSIQSPHVSDMIIELGNTIYQEYLDAGAPYGENPGSLERWLYEQCPVEKSEEHE